MNKYVLVVFVLATASAVLAQQSTPTAGEKTRANADSNSYNLPGGYTGKPNEMLKTVNVKAVVQAVDLQQRSVRVTPEREGESFKIATAMPEKKLEWGQMDEFEMVFFGQPEGMEKIEVSKAVAKQQGKKTLSLEDLKVGSVLKAAIYPVRTEGNTKVAAQKVTVEKLGQ